MGLVCLSLRRWISDELLWFGAELLLADADPAYCPLSFLLFLPFKHRWTLGEIFFVKKCIFPADLSQPRRRVYNLLNFARESRNSVADLHFSLETVGTQGRDARLPQTWSAHGHWTNENTNTIGKNKNIKKQNCPRSVILSTDSVCLCIRKLNPTPTIALSRILTVRDTCIMHMCTCIRVKDHASCMHPGG